jgi:4-hydroxy 2-oxovalerate aldolase
LQRNLEIRTYPELYPDCFSVSIIPAHGGSMFRPELKLLDCSIRDGGLINNWQFSDDFVRSNVVLLNEAGVDYIEAGYKASRSQFDPKVFGKWRFCFDEDIKKIVDGIDLSSKL